MRPSGADDSDTEGIVCAKDPGGGDCGKPAGDDEAAAIQHFYVALRWIGSAMIVSNSGNVGET